MRERAFGVSTVVSRLHEPRSRALFSESVSICVHLWFQFLPRHPLEFEPRVFKIQDETDPKAGDFEVIDHLALLLVCDFFERLRVNDHLAEHNQVRHVETHGMLFVEHVEPVLLLAGNGLQAELHDERILVNLLVKSVPNLIQNLEGAADDTVRFLL